MNGILLLIVSAIYMIVGIRYYVESNVGLSLAFICYSIANLGIWWSSR